MTNDNTPFPLHQWFELSRRISRDDRRSCEDKMALYAYKDGMAPNGPKWRAGVAQLQAAVREHNARF